MKKLLQADKMCNAAIAKAKELGIKITVCVVDEHGVTVALKRMDGAFHISPKFAFSKAHTSALLGLPSGDIAEYAQEGKPYFSINTAFGGELITIPGGLPIKEGDVTVGGIGVGGSLDVRQDVECAQAGIDALK